MVIWAYASVLDGPDALNEPYIIPGADPSGIRIEPALARRDALAYLSKLQSIAHPFDLPELEGKNRCGGVIAYSAHLAGTLGRGIMDECRKVLVGLLTEHMS